MKIVGINLQPGAVGWHRTWHWTKLLRSRGHQVWDNPDAKEQFKFSELDAIVKGADIVLTAQMAAPETFAALLAGRDLYGYKLVVDSDDPVDIVPKYNPAFADYHVGGGAGRLMKAQLRAADLATVATERLKEWSPNPRTVVIPNVVDLDDYAKVRMRAKEPRHQDDVRLYWGGGAGHYADLLIMRDAVLRLMDEHPNLKLVFTNFVPDWAAHLSPSRMFRIPMTSFQKYPKILQWLCVDIAVAPLEDNAFNSYKSNVKYLFYAMAGLPGVYSDLEPYRCVQDGVTGLLAKPSEWYDKLKYLIENPEARRRIGSSAKNDVLSRFTLAQHGPRHEAMLHELLAVKSPEVVGLEEGVPVEAKCLTAP